jgi:hypothetical protein
MRRSFALVAALALSAHAFVAHADDATKRAKVEQMLTVTKTDTISQNMLANVPVRVKTLAARQPAVAGAATPEQKKLADDYLNQMGTIAQGGANWTALKPKVVDLYMSTYTEADLDGILAFFKTPAGQDYVAKSPELSGKTVDILQGAISALQPQFEAATRAFQTQMQNLPVTPAGTAPAKPPTLGPPTLQPRN